MNIKDILKIANGKIENNNNLENIEILGISSFEDAQDGYLTYAVNSKYLKKLNETKAKIILVPNNYNFQASETNKIFIKVANPLVAFIKIVEIFQQNMQSADNKDFMKLNHISSISPNCFIGENFLFGKNLSIGHFVNIGKNVSIGDNCKIYSNTFIGDSVKIGNNAKIYPNVSVLDGSIIGDRVIIHAGSVIGSDGFGFTPDEEKYLKIPHSGIVQIDNDVEIGANNTIDRATFGKTWIKSGVKTDNLVHIAHNVVIGENTLLVAQVGIAGSATIGKHVILAGQAGIAGHIEIQDNAIIGPQSGVGKSVSKGEILTGTPAMPHKTFLKAQNIVQKLPEINKKIRELEKRLNNLEKSEESEKSKESEE